MTPVERFPVTTTGRIIAVGLMLVGIAVVGVVTASVAAWLVANVQHEAQGTVESADHG